MQHSKLAPAGNLLTISLLALLATAACTSTQDLGRTGSADSGSLSETIIVGRADGGAVCAVPPPPRASALGLSSAEATALFENPTRNVPDGVSAKGLYQTNVRGLAVRIRIGNEEIQVGAKLANEDVLGLKVPTAGWHGTAGSFQFTTLEGGADFPSTGCTGEDTVLHVASAADARLSFDTSKTYQLWGLIDVTKPWCCSRNKPIFGMQVITRIGD